MRAVIFDADGTLLDSMYVWNNIGKAYLLGQGKAPEPDVDRKIMAMSFADSCKYFIEHYGLNKTVADITREISDMVADKYRYEVELKRGAAQYIAHLKDNGIRLCVVTASERGYITECLKRLKVYDSFEFVMTCSEEGLDKNSADIYDRAAERLKATTEEVLIFEDAINAISAAKRGGYTVYAMADESMKSYEAEIKQIADRYVKDFDELLKA